MTKITIVHQDGSDVLDVDDENHIEEVDIYNEGVNPSIRIWHSDPSVDDSDYTDYVLGTITEVSP